MKNLMFIFALSSSLCFASSFKLKSSLSNQKLNSIASTTKSIISNTKIFGECGDVQKFKVIKTKNEKNINTIKQLLIIAQKVDAANDEQDYVSEVSPKNSFTLAKTLLDFTMDNQVESWLNNDEDFAIFKNKENELARSIYKNSRTSKSGEILFFESSHSNEDGTWNSLSIYDTHSQEALVLSVGFCST